MTTFANPTISTRAMLVDLTIRQWSGTKNDKTVSREVARNHGADETMGRYNKSLISKEAIEKIRKLAVEIAAEHRRRTLPWLDTGARILSSAGYQDYAAKMREFSDRWDVAVSDFVSNYDDYRDDARNRLGSLFNDADYPSRWAISERFAVGYNVLPVPDASDFRVDLGDYETARIQRSIEDASRAATEQAMGDVRDRIVDTVTHMVDRLNAYTVTAEGVSGVFRDSLVENVRSLVDILPSLNLTQNPALDRTISRMRDELCKHSADKLRIDRRAREETAAAAADILSTMADFVA